MLILMKCYAFLFPILLLFSFFVEAQQTANTYVPPYQGSCLAGSNLGYYEGWQDEQLAEIAHGNPAKGVDGVGVKSIRPTLPEHFLEQWGYNIRIDAFKFYKELGLRDLVCFVQGPTESHRETEKYCTSDPSHLFANIYEPIWKDTNRQVINEENYFAAYLYKTVSKYKDYIKVWEIWNEPDFSYTANSLKKRGEVGNWWENNPSPCDYKLKAPIFHYIRTLKISYEIIKSIDPDAFVAVGGLGYPSFLDAILRNTDNPDGGKVTNDFPLKGGAYFDVLSYHSYPHIDGSVRAWNTAKADFEYFRHSDRAVRGVFNLQDQFESVLIKHKYDGDNYPKKHFLITEINIPRVAIDENMGSLVSQRNFLMKSLIGCKERNVLSMHVFNIAEAPASENNNNSFSYMGLYRSLKNVKPYQQSINSSGEGYRTTSILLDSTFFDEVKTKAMNLPLNIRGGAFRKSSGEYIYALWAATRTDKSEDVQALYSFPKEFDYDLVSIKDWDFAKTNLESLVFSDAVELSGTPIFIEKSDEEIVIPKYLEMTVAPNPMIDSTVIEYYIQRETNVSILLISSKGQVVFEILNQRLTPGKYQKSISTLNLQRGVYFVKLQTDTQLLTKKIVRN